MTPIQSADIQRRALPACMGGWCETRDSCARFHASNRAYPSERLCSPHRSDMWQPISFKTQQEST